MTRDAGGPGLRTADLIIAALAALAAVLTLVQEPLRAPLLLCLALALVPWVLVAAGRELPLPVFAALAVLPVIPVGLWTGLGSVFFLATAAGMRVAARSDRVWLTAATAVVVVVAPVLPFLLAGEEWDRGILYFALGNTFGIAAGLLVRQATRLAGELRAADARLAEAAAREERHRIARDVHDLVAHSLTVVVLQVGGARRVLRADPGAAEQALADAERVCRESLDGIRGVVGLLRDADGGPPSLSLRLTDLVETYRAAGLPVTLDARGAPESLPLVLRVTLHRVVQEALANAARHAGHGAATTVSVAVDDSRVTARVVNECPAGIPAARGFGGHGLRGLQERVASVGGRLAGGPEDGRWVVECALPVRPGAWLPEPAAPAVPGGAA